MSASASCRWRHAREVSRPFGGSALTYVKRLLVEAGMHRPSEEEIATRLARLLHELSDEDLFRDRRARREAVRQAVIAEQRRTRPGSRRTPPAPASRSRPMAWAGIEIPTSGARAVIDPGAERWRRLTVKEGWRRFVDDEPTEQPGAR